MTNPPSSTYRREPEEEATYLPEEEDEAQGPSLWLVALSAVIAALIVHGVLLLFLPLLDQNKQRRNRALDEEEVSRIIYTAGDVEELKEAEIVAPEESEPQELDSIDPGEIDVLDIEIQELDMAPGDTTISMAAPDMPDDSSVSDIGLPLSDAPTESPVMAAALESSVVSLPEPTPINTNEVVVNAMAQSLNVDASSAELTAQLNEAASQTAGLPSDTRSLADLMKIGKLGAASGVARLGSDVLFEFGKSTLHNSARVTLLQLAALIHKNPDTLFIIEGHTDSIGKPEFNDLLSLQRAAAVRVWLQGNQVPCKNVYLRACGSRVPLVDIRKSREEQGLNRRVEIHMRQPQEQLPPGCVPASYAVDVKSPVATLLARGVRAPQAFAEGEDDEYAEEAD